MGMMKMRIDQKIRKELEKGIGKGNREDEDKERRRIKKNAEDGEKVRVRREAI